MSRMYEIPDRCPINEKHNKIKYVFKKIAMFHLS